MKEPTVPVESKDVQVLTDAEKAKQIINSLSGLLSGVAFDAAQQTTQLSQVTTLFKSNRWYMLSNMRQILSELYAEHGLIQTFVDQPVDDAFSKGITILCDQLSEEENAELTAYLEEHNILDTIKQGIKWNRLYGGGGVLVVTGQPPETPLAELKKGDKVKFIDIDMWELFYTKQNTEQGGGTMSYEQISSFNDGSNQEFNYYGTRVNGTRTLIMKGKKAPSFIRPRLRGWGMSIVERVVRSYNQYMKNEEVLFEFMDEGKIDVYKFKGFNTALATKGGTEDIQKKAQLTNQLKSFTNSVVMDMEDEYQQKQIAFSGIAAVIQQVRQGICSDLRMPMTKLFGQSTGGFSEGEGETENYNAMIESEVRTPSKPVIIGVLKIICQSLFGMTPTDLKVQFPSLRVLNSEQEQAAKNAEYNRYSGMYAQGMLTAKEYSELLKKHDLLDIDTEVMAGTRDAEIPEPPASFALPEKIVSESAGKTE